MSVEWSDLSTSVSHSVFAFHPGSICYEELPPQNVFFWIWLDKIIAARAVSSRAWVLTSRDKLSHSCSISQLHRQVIVPNRKGRMIRCGHIRKRNKEIQGHSPNDTKVRFFRRQEANVTKQSWPIRVWPCSSLTCPWWGSSFPVEWPRSTKNCEISSRGTNSSSG